MSLYNLKATRLDVAATLLLFKPKQRHASSHVLCLLNRPSHSHSPPSLASHIVRPENERKGDVRLPGRDRSCDQRRCPRMSSAGLSVFAVARGIGAIFGRRTIFAMCRETVVSKYGEVALNVCRDEGRCASRCVLQIARLSCLGANSRN